MRPRTGRQCPAESRTPDTLSLRRALLYCTLDAIVESPCSNENKMCCVSEVDFRLQTDKLQGRESVMWFRTG